VSLIYIVPVVLVTAIGGALPGLLSGLAGFFLLNWYFTPPIGTFSIASGRDITALTIFILTTIIINILVDKAARKSIEALHIRSHATALSRATMAILQEDDPLPIIVREIERNFLITGLSLIRQNGDITEIVISSGSAPPKTATEATFAFPVSESQTILITCHEINPQDKEMLETFINQIKVILVNKELSFKAQESVALSKANEIRTALLAAVSHDLRTPLASIKAASTGYLSNEGSLGDGEKQLLIRTIDEETNRLNTLVDNLLDMSRIYTGSMQLHFIRVGIYEVISSAIVSLGIKDNQIATYVPESLPEINTDPFLLERAVANMLSNAINVSPEGEHIKIVAEVISDKWLEIRIIDRGPGIAVEHRGQIFLPFQRLGDDTSGKGVGLGLAVAKGFIDLLDGKIEIEDTPGGGVSMVIKLKYIAE